MLGLVLLASSVCFADAGPQYVTARASELDPSAREYPEANFTFGTDKKPQDVQTAAFDPAVESRGQLVIWLMAPNRELFDRVTSYGYHVVQPHYARGWFGTLCQENPVGETCRGDLRLEAATGEDFSNQIDLRSQDGMVGRTVTFLKRLDREQPDAEWGQFLAGDGLRYDKVVMAGASHGSTTSARFAKHQKVARVVMFCGPRDQYQTWQSLPSATPANRYFGFSHTLDGGWTADHYCRSWELIGLHEYGPIVDVDKSRPPFDNTRRLVTSFDVDGDAKRAHSAVQPGKRAYTLSDGTYAHEAVWRYLFTHPVDEVGMPVAMDDDCDKNQRDEP